MSDQTKSALLFERYCRDNQIHFEPVPRQDNQKTPDYVIHPANQFIPTEVKEIRSNPTDEEVRRELRARGSAAWWALPGSRARNPIHKARNQLSTCAGETYPAMIVLYDNSPFGAVDAEEIKIAMYGLETVTLDRDRKVILSHCFGDNAECRTDCNETISAVALLHEHRGTWLSLSVFHNIYARNPIDPDWLGCQQTEHWAIDVRPDRAYQEWRRV